MYRQRQNDALRIDFYINKELKALGNSGKNHSKKKKISPHPLVVEKYETRITLLSALKRINPTTLVFLMLIFTILFFSIVFVSINALNSDWKKDEMDIIFRFRSPSRMALPIRNSSSEMNKPRSSQTVLSHVNMKSDSLLTNMSQYLTEKKLFHRNKKIISPRWNDTFGQSHKHVKQETSRQRNISDPSYNRTYTTRWSQRLPTHETAKKKIDQESTRNPSLTINNVDPVKPIHTLPNYLQYILEDNQSSQRNFTTFSKIANNTSPHQLISSTDILEGKHDFNRHSQFSQRQSDATQLQMNQSEYMLDQKQLFQDTTLDSQFFASIQSQQNLSKYILESENQFQRNRTNSLQNQNHKPRWRPTLILHVGPPKTATTTIQDSLVKLWDMLSNQDNCYYYHRGFIGNHTFGRKAFDMWGLIRELNDIMGTDRQQRELRYNDVKIPTNYTKYREQVGSWNDQIRKKTHGMSLSTDEGKIFPNAFDFFSTLNQHYNSNSTVIISVEQFCYDNTLYLIPFFDKWNVRVVVTYRRYFDWITSKYYQENASIEEKELETIASFINKTMENKKKLFDLSRNSSDLLPMLHPTYYAIRKFSTMYTNVQIFDFHSANSTNLMKSFVCDMIPEAMYTCAYLSSEEGQKSYGKQRKRESSRLDMLVLARAFAQQEGFIVPKQQFLFRIWKEIDFFQKEDFPLKCVKHEVLEQVLSMSLEFEKKILHNVSDSHVRDFQKSLKNRKFCDVDYKKVLQEQEWRNFLFDFFTKLDELNGETNDNEKSRVDRKPLTLMQIKDRVSAIKKERKKKIVNDRISPVNLKH